MNDIIHWQAGDIEPPEPTAARVVQYIGPSPRPTEGGAVGRREPQAFLVWLGTDYGELQTHYHPADQFQAFVIGDGSIGHHSIEPGYVHYADANQPYGPIDVGTREGLGFLTLRGVSDSGMHTMPESQAELAEALAKLDDPSARRNITHDLNKVADAQPNTWSAVVRHDDGVQMQTVTLEPGARVQLPEAAPGGDFLFVIEGTIVSEGEERGPISGGWRSADAGDVSIVGGAEGAQVALLGLRSQPSGVG